VQHRQLLQGFFLTVVLEGLEFKYHIKLSRGIFIIPQSLIMCLLCMRTEWKILKNRRFVGTLPEQNVRTQSKPWIMDMSG
jgi:hypothetical protein